MFNPALRVPGQPLFIGLGHYKRTGKDSFADFLIRALYYRCPTIKVIKKSFAWKLKQICHELYGWAGLREPEFYETIHGAELREVVLECIGKSPRQIWIDFGTDAVREKVYDRTWLDYLLRSKHDADVIIVPDTRFINEAEAMKTLNATLIKVVRPGYGPGPNRPDRELLGYQGWDNVIGDEGTMGSLQRWADRYAEWICGGAPVSSTPEEIEAALAVEQIVPWVEELSLPTEKRILFDEKTARAIFELTNGGRVFTAKDALWPIIEQLMDAFPAIAYDYAYRSAA